MQPATGKSPSKRMIERSHAKVQHLLPASAGHFDPGNMPAKPEKPSSRFDCVHFMF
jgi:hypothetical protein